MSYCDYFESSFVDDDFDSVVHPKIVEAAIDAAFVAAFVLKMLDWNQSN